MPLPLPPQIPQPQPGPMGQQQVLPGQPGTGAVAGQALSGLAQGLQSFLTQYLGRKDQEKKGALEKAKAGLELLRAGIPVDQEEVMKNLKKSGLKLTEDPEALAASRFFLEQGQTQQPTQMGIQSPTFGQVDMSLPAGSPGMQPGPQAMQQIPPTGAAFLQNLQQRGQSASAAEFDTKEKAEKMKQQYLGIVKSALMGDPDARETATRMKIGPNGLPLFDSIQGDDLMYLTAHQLNPGEPAKAQRAVVESMMYRAMGGPQKEMKMMELAKDMAPRFGNDLKKATNYVSQVFSGKEPTELPEMSFDERYKVNDMVMRMQAARPTAPLDVLYMTAMAQLTPGQEKWAADLQSTLLAKFPTAAQLAETRFDKRLAFDKDAHKDNIQIRRQQMAQTMYVADRAYAFEQLKNYQALAEREFDNAYKINTDKNSSPEMRDSAINMMVDALTKQGHKVDKAQVDKMFQFMRKEEFYPKFTRPDTSGAAGKMPVSPSTWQKIVLLGGGFLQESLKGMGFMDDEKEN